MGIIGPEGVLMLPKGCRLLAVGKERSSTIHKVC